MRIFKAVFYDGCLLVVVTACLMRINLNFFKIDRF
jgi:hypothetical protein